MITSFISKIFGTANDRKIKQLQSIVDQINSYEPTISALSDAELAAKTNEFREQLSAGKTTDDILPEAYAVVREASRRQLGQRHYDVQLMGGIVLHQGCISEMKTGEGKTLTATLPLYLNALSGKGAHLVTVNDYLAKRDSEWMKPIYESLGLTVACLQNSMNDDERKKVYSADILYATNNELGFDYLRDNMKFRLEDYVQRDLNFAIVDEVDSILIDEARTPLIISGAANQSSELYILANKAIMRLNAETDYEVDEKARNAQLTESGVDKIEEMFRIDNLYSIEHLILLHHISQALKAHSLFRCDVDYVVKDNKVLIVDEFTGRILSGRRYSDGLHQALEAKEGVRIERESQTLASITLQNYFRLYTKLAGMTGTAVTEAEEFYRIYKLNVVVIPTNRPLIRIDQPDLIFLTKNAKYQEIVTDIQERHKKGQPILIGTIAIETSELISDVLKRAGIPHEVLNAKQHQREAEIIAHAGEPGHITIATNMAGRGTDIKLTQASKNAGGLYILGTERHESRRIDNQLRGRSGRQGDAGESRFYISLEDDLTRIFGGDKLKARMISLGGMTEEDVIENRFISRSIENAQEKVEKHNFEIRKHLLEYDDVLNQQRTVIYDFRRTILEGTEHTFDLIRDMIIKAVQTLVGQLLPTRTVTPEEVNTLFETISKMTGIASDTITNAGISQKNTDALTTDLESFVLEQYQLFRKQQDSKDAQEAERWLLLETIDMAWKQHMLNLDNLKEGIGLRKNPLVEYKKEAFALFQDMMNATRFDVIHHLFHRNLEQFDQNKLEEKRERELEEIQMSAASSEESTSAQRQSDKVGRNDPCPCGSGKKYKKCCEK